jgi:hypothetical protein
MKTSLTLLLFCCTLSSFYSQDYPCDPKSSSGKCGQWELGINLFSLQHAKSNRNNKLIIPAFASGVILKRHCRNHAWRLAFDRFDYSYFEKSYENVRPTWWHEANYHTIKHELRFGWEHAISKRKIKPYIALDLVLGYLDINIRSVGEGDFEPGVFYYQGTRSHKQIGLATSIGLKYHCNDRISIALETNAGFYYEQIKSPPNEKSYYDRSDTFYHLLRSFAVHYKF